MGATKPFRELMELGCKAHGLPLPTGAIEEAFMKAAFKLAAEVVGEERQS